VLHEPFVTCQSPCHCRPPEGVGGYSGEQRMGTCCGPCEDSSGPSSSGPSHSGPSHSGPSQSNGSVVEPCLGTGCGWISVSDGQWPPTFHWEVLLDGCEGGCHCAEPPISPRYEGELTGYICVR
jgi:hypothetical protein